MAAMSDWDSVESDEQNSYSPKKINRTLTTFRGVDTHFVDMVKKVLQYKHFGITLSSIKLIDVSSSCGKTGGDRLKMSIPYAKQDLNWTVMFDSMMPELGPDFEFSDKFFLADPDLILLEEKLPDWTEWKPNEQDCLLKILFQLVQCYKQHQIDKLTIINQRLQSEYDFLVQKAEFSEADVELILLPEVNEPKEIHFLIRLAMDLSKLPGIVADDDEDSAILHIVFQGSQWKRIVAHLTFSEKTEKILGETDSFHIPPFLPDKTLAAYANDIKKLIHDKMTSITMSFESRRNFISAVLFFRHNSVIEYDATDFTYIIFMLEHQDFFFFVHFHLSPEFPSKPPTTSLQSIYHMTGDEKLYTQNISTREIPYSPRWDAPKMVMEAINYILSSPLSTFKKNSSRLTRR